MINNKDKKIGNLYKEMVAGTATASTFEEAIREQNLTVELISLITIYYDNDFIEDKRKIGAAYLEAQLKAKLKETKPAKLSKKQMLEQIKNISVFKKMSHLNARSYAEIKNLYEDGVAVGVIKPTGATK